MLIPILVLLSVIGAVVIYFFFIRKQNDKKGEIACALDDVLCRKSKLGARDTEDHVDDSTIFPFNTDIDTRETWLRMPSLLYLNELQKYNPETDSVNFFAWLLMLQFCSEMRSKTITLNEINTFINNNNTTTPTPAPLSESQVLEACEDMEFLALPFVWIAAATKTIVKFESMTELYNHIKAKQSGMTSTAYYGMTAFIDFSKANNQDYVKNITFYELDGAMMKAAIEDGGQIALENKQKAGGKVVCPVYIRGQSNTRVPVSKKDASFFANNVKWYAMRDGKNLLGYSDDTIAVAPSGGTIIFRVPNA